MRQLLAVLLLITASSFLQAEVVIDVPNRVKNLGYGVCAWCSIEMSGRQLGISTLHGLAARRDKQSRELITQLTIGPNLMPAYTQTERRDNGATVSNIRDELDKLGVHYQYQPEGTRGYNMLLMATHSNGPGAVVGLYGYAYTKSTVKTNGHLHLLTPTGDTGYHDVLLTDLDDKWACFMDPNDISEPWIVSRSWFDKHWDGASVVLVRPDQPKPTVVRAAAAQVAATLPTSALPSRRHPNRAVQAFIDSGLSESDALRVVDRLNGTSHE